MNELQPDYDSPWKEAIEQYFAEEESQMPLLSGIELEAMQKGLEEGIQQGIQQGILQNAREDAIAVLEIRFERVPPEAIEAINRIEDTSLLKQLLRQAIAIPSIKEFQQLLEQPLASEDNSAEGN